MIDFKKLRKDPDAFYESLRGKKMDRELFDRCVELDKKLLEVERGIQELRTERNKLNKRT